MFAIPSSDNTWFACPNCKVDLPRNAWAAAHLNDHLTIKCDCGTHLDIPTKLPSEKQTNGKHKSKRQGKRDSQSQPE